MKRLALTLATIAVAAACGGPSAQAASKPKLTDLHSVGQLRTLFNAHAGRPRLILLMSPT